MNKIFPQFVMMCIITKFATPDRAGCIFGKSIICVQAGVFNDKICFGQLCKVLLLHVESLY
jgi:hypothetical protein